MRTMMLRRMMMKMKNNLSKMRSVFVKEDLLETHMKDVFRRKYQMAVIVNVLFSPHETPWQFENMKTVMVNISYLMYRKKTVAQYTNILRALSTCINEMVIGWSQTKLGFTKLDYKIRFQSYFKS